MKKEELISTGETMILLNEVTGHKVISRSTVSRWFDQGRISGWKNPLSGKRMIDVKSLEPIIKKLTKGK
jgi:predicted site-specific integrase-resolvase